MSSKCFSNQLYRSHSPQFKIRVAKSCWFQATSEGDPRTTRRPILVLRHPTTTVRPPVIQHIPPRRTSSTTPRPVRIVVTKTPPNEGKSSPTEAPLAGVGGGVKGGGRPLCFLLRIPTDGGPICPFSDGEDDREAEDRSEADLMRRLTARNRHPQGNTIYI